MAQAVPSTGHEGFFYHTPYYSAPLLPPPLTRPLPPMMYTDTKLKEYNEREERFRLAIEEATTNKAASINSIANKYKVSRTTLSRRIHGFKNTRNSHEKQQKFTNDEELTIVGHIQSMLRDQHHIPQKREILQICENLLKDKHKDQQDIDPSFFKVGKNWIDRFLERHNSELMINDQVTLAEYYKNEFLERKKLRTERGYKTTSVGSLTPEEESLDATPHSSNSPGSQAQTADTQQIHPPRMPYQSEPNPAYIYQDPSVNMNYNVAQPPQPQPQFDWQQQQQQFHNLKQSQSPYVPQQNTTQMAPPQYGSLPVSAKFNYSFPQPSSTSTHSPMVSYAERASSSTSLPAQMNQSYMNSNIHNFGFPQSSTPAVEPSGSDVEMMQFYQNGRFQYELARAKIVKDLELGNVDTATMTRMVNFVFAQVERDVNGGTGQAYGMTGY